MSKADKLAKAARSYGGVLVARCGQGEPPMRAMLGMNDKTNNGICRTMVAKWFIELKNARDYWSWLTPGGKVNSAAVGNLMMVFADIGKLDVEPTTVEDIKNPKRGKGSTAYFANYLSLYGVFPSKQTFTTGEQNGYSMVAGGRAPEEAGRVIRDMAPGAAAYAFIGMSKGLSSGHAVGAFVAADRSTKYYDPNIGQIDFPSTADLAKWLAKSVGALVYADYTRVGWDWYD